jgi:hypothetical protein
MAEIGREERVSLGELGFVAGPFVQTTTEKLFTEEGKREFRTAYEAQRKKTPEQVTIFIKGFIMCVVTSRDELEMFISASIAAAGGPVYFERKYDTHTVRFDEADLVEDPPEYISMVHSTIKGLLGAIMADTKEPEKITTHRVANEGDVWRITPHKPKWAGEYDFGGATCCSACCFNCCTVCKDAFEKVSAAGFFEGEDEAAAEMRISCLKARAEAMHERISAVQKRVREFMRQILEKKDMAKLKASIPENWGVNQHVNAAWDTPFSYCAYIGWEDGMRYLHSLGANVSKTDHDDCTVLMHPLYEFRIVKLAVELGVDVLYKNCHAETCLSCRESYLNRKACDVDQSMKYLEEIYKQRLAEQRKSKANDDSE